MESMGGQLLKAVEEANLEEVSLRVLENFWSLCLHFVRS
jgi:hypothetical protein